MKKQNLDFELQSLEISLKWNIIEFRITWKEYCNITEDDSVAVSQTKNDHV